MHKNRTALKAMQSQPESQEEEMRETFQVFDKDGDGRVNAADLKYAENDLLNFN
jgi:Ca2+-binding EF-hand superfamily protein